MTTTHPHAAPRQFIYLHQRDRAMMARCRAWFEWLSEGRSVNIEGELIALDVGDDPVELLRSSQNSPGSTENWQVLIYEPPGLGDHRHDRPEGLP